MIRPLELHRAARAADKRADVLCAAHADAYGEERWDLNRKAAKALGEAADAYRDLAAWYRRLSLVALLVSLAGLVVSAIARAAS
jgi:hypothetical protein